MTEPQRIYLATIDTSETSALAISVPPTASAAEIAQALVVAEAEKAAAQARESERLRKLFLKDESQ